MLCLTRTGAQPLWPSLRKQWSIFHREHLPPQVEEIYNLLVRPLAETYRIIGIEASHRLLNDIVVGGRKIGGTGIAAIGEFYSSFDVQAPGITPEDIARAILKIEEASGGS